jgi:hypothetical protein
MEKVTGAEDDIDRVADDCAVRLDALYRAEYSGMVGLAYTLVGNNAEAEGYGLATDRDSACPCTTRLPIRSGLHPATKSSSCLWARTSGASERARPPGETSLRASGIGWCQAGDQCGPPAAEKISVQGSVSAERRGVESTLRRVSRC